MACGSAESVSWKGYSIMEYGKEPGGWTEAIREAAEQSHISAVYLLEEGPQQKEHMDGKTALLIEMDNHTGLSDYFRFQAAIERVLGSHLEIHTTEISEGTKLKEQADSLVCIYRKELIPYENKEKGTGA